MKTTGRLMDVMTDSFFKLFTFFLFPSRAHKKNSYATYRKSEFSFKGLNRRRLFLKIGGLNHTLLHRFLKYKYVLFQKLKLFNV